MISLLQGHTITKAKDAGWDRLANGELLNAAEAAGFDLLVTPRKNMRCQQTLARRRVIATIDSAAPGSFAEVEIPIR